MNITFLIGNGFDIKLGLKTRYTDFYPTYIASNKNRSEDDSIRKFTDLIAPDYETWADFEMAFAENAFGTQQDVKEILRDFSDKFANYLEEQSRLCNYTDENISTKFRDFLINGYKFLENKDRQLIEDIYASVNDNIFISFINFNYTNTLDKLIETYEENNSIVLQQYSYQNKNYMEFLNSTLNLHGTLNDSIIIGIDSIKQLSDENLNNDDSLSRYCVKSAINEYVGNKKIEDDFIELIISSKIIYAYGLSFGKSDKSRWDIIVKWLISDIDNKLIIYKYKPKFTNFQSVYKPILLDVIEDEKDYYLDLLGFDESEYIAYRDQIFVIDSDDVLDFKLIKETIDEQEESLEVCTA